ncbi:hypothetical protein JXL83_01875 [candidate division WOR-3 bacterium]|nr:hypothetical protein [candidate division WOR-3 bacterium]
MTRFIIILLSCVALITLMQGCCGACNLGDKISEKVGEEIGEQITEGITGGDVDISDGSITIKDSTGSYQYSDDVDLDDYDLDEDIVYPGARAKSVMFVEEDEFDNYSVVFETDDSPGDAINYYKNLTGWDIVMETSHPEGYMVQIKKDNSEATVSTSKNSDGDNTLVTVIYTEHK